MATKSNVPTDYESLLKEYRQQQSDLEAHVQNLYECKRQLKLAESLQAEYQQEIELVQAEDKSLKEKLRAQIATLEDTLSESKSSSEEKLQHLELLLSQSETEKESLKADLEALKSRKQDNCVEDTEFLYDKIQKLQQQNDELFAENEILKMSCQEDSSKHNQLQEEFAMVKGELEELRESFNCKRQELGEAQELNETLNEELLVIKNELQMLKSKPLDQASQGNSLFAEVDDRRVFLQQTIDNMRASFCQMKQERSRNLAQIARLKHENLVLCQRFREDQVEIDEDNDLVAIALKDRIAVLEKKLEKYEDLSQDKHKTLGKLGFEQADYFTKQIEAKTKEINQLLTELQARTRCRVVLSQAITKANAERRKWRLDAIWAQCQLEVVKIEVDNKDKLVKLEDLLRIASKKWKNFQQEDNPKTPLYEPPKTTLYKPMELKENLEYPELETSALKDVQEPDEKVKGILKPSNDGNLDNQAKEKTVKKAGFSEDTAEPKLTNRATMSRRGGRVVEVPKPVVFSMDDLMKVKK